MTHKAASYTVQVGDSGKVFVADAGDVVFTLPAVAENLTFTFIDGHGVFNHPVIVRPQSGEWLRSATVSGGAVSKGLMSDNGNGNAGETLEVLGVAGLGWVVIAQTPNVWDYEA